MFPCLKWPNFIITLSLIFQFGKIVNSILLLASFSYQRHLVVFHWSDIKSFQVSKTHQDILVDLSNGWSWFFLLFPIVPFPLFKLLGTFSNVPTTITLMFLNLFFFFNGKVEVFFELFGLLYFPFVVYWNSKTHKTKKLTLDLIIWPGFDDPSVSQNHTESYGSHSQEWILVSAYTIWI